MKPHRVRVPLAVRLALAVAALAGVAAADSPPRSPPEKPVDYHRAVARLEEMIAGEIKRGAFSAVSIALVDDQQTVYANGFGLADKDRGVPATAQTVYRAGSISKLLTALAAMQLVEQGKLDIVKPETLRQMCTVQLTGDKTGYGLGFLVGTFRKHPSVSHMGAVYGFTSSLVVLPDVKLGAVVLSNEDIAIGPVRKLSDAALGLMLEAKLGEPMPKEEPPKTPAPDPAALVGDYESESYWARIELQQGVLGGALSGRRMFLTPTGLDKFLAEVGWSVSETLEFQRDEKGRAVGFTVLSQKFRRVDPAAVPEVPAEWQKYVGSYGPDFIPVIISVRHGHLYAMTENEADYRLTPLCRTVFKLPPGMYVDEQVVFQVAPDGQVPSILFANMPLKRREKRNLTGAD